MKQLKELESILRKIRGIKSPRGLTNGASLTFETELNKAQAAIVRAEILLKATKETNQ